MPENSDGVIPGEAAAVLLLQNQVAKAGEAALKVLGIGLGREEAHILSGRPLLGLGLTNATHLALEDAEVELGAVDFRLSDVTGESYGFKEQSIVLSRVLRGRRTCFPLWHFSDAIGDIGAAAGAVLVTMASHAFQEGYALGDRAICFCSSVDGERGVAVLQRGQSGITS
jgi:3-oxoacyl-[acyl-carrier-protein] synthase-1